MRRLVVMSPGETSLQEGEEGKKLGLQSQTREEGGRRVKFKADAVIAGNGQMGLSPAPPLQIISILGYCCCNGKRLGSLRLRNIGGGEGRRNTTTQR